VEAVPGGQTFSYIHTDQKSLKELLTQTIQTPKQQKWAAKLQGFSFDIHYKPGKSNLVADALSRKHSDDTTSLFMSISSTIPHLLQDLHQYYRKNEQGRKLVEDSTQQENSNPLYNFKNGLLFFKDRIYIPDLPDWRQSIISEYHNSPTAGHSGAKPTFSRLAASFLWPNAHKEVKTWVKQCSTCQQNKYLPTKKQGLLQPLDIPRQVWEDLTMDFVTHLPNSMGHMAIWVICDRLSKFVHFIALPTKFTAKTLAVRFSTEICRLHGVPNSIISDRDPLFLSKFWQELLGSKGQH
jgi:hypothetical protein